MRDFDYKDRPKEALIPEIVSMLTRLYEYRGRQELFMEARTEDERSGYFGGKDPDYNQPFSGSSGNGF